MAASRSRRPVGGLIIKKSNQPVPLKEVSVEAEIKACVLGLQSHLKYCNDSPDPIEVMFRFPLEESSAVVGLSAVIDGRRIKADLKEKEQARADYEDAIASGQSAALAEEKAGDIFSVTLGNLPPGKKAEIDLQVVAELPIDAEENIRFSLPSVFKPRYTPAGSTDPLAEVSAPGGQVSSAQVAGFSKFQLTIFESDGIDTVTSPTHTLSVNDSSDSKMAVSLTGRKPVEKDLVILIKPKEPHRPSVVVEEGNGQETGFMSGKAVMVNFFPKFEHKESKCEFIFLVDRSGSMGGQFIQSASETLILFMKSLPEDCNFNIIGFGSRYEQLFQGGSVPYSQSTLDKAVGHLTGLQANLGGTELLSPLEFIFSTKAPTEFSRQMFVLTDGAVSNTDACVKKVKANRENSRCFTFGIGSGASTALVEGLAQAGNGSAEFVKEGERLQPKVIRSLKRALQPAVTDVSVEFKIDGKPDILQSPQTLPPVFAGEKLVIYAILKTKSKGPKVKATLRGKISRQTISESVELRGGAPESSPIPTVHHLAGKALIKDWEREGRAEEEIVKLSVECGVVSSHTAFIAVDEENSKPIESALQTWDLQTQYMSYGFGGGRGGGGGMHMFKNKKKGGKHLMNSAPRGIRTSSAPMMKSRAAPQNVSYMSSGPPPPPMAQGGPPPPPPPTISRGSPPPPAPMMAGGPPPPPAPMMAGGPPPLPPPSMLMKFASSSAPQSAKLLPSQNARSADQSLDSSRRSEVAVSSVVSLSAIIGAQQADGSWRLNSELARFVGKSVEEVRSGCPTECEGVVGGVWATLLVLELLHSQWEDDLDEWELVGAKAESWTKKQSLPTGVTLDQLKAAAKNLLA